VSIINGAEIPPEDVNSWVQEKIVTFWDLSLSEAADSQRPNTMTPESSDPPSSTPPPGDTNRLKIHNWASTTNPITESTPLVRYMKLGTFLLLLDNRLFIPTLGLLQSTDRFELRTPKRSLRSYGQRMLHILEPYEDWLLRTTHGPKRFKGAGPELKAEPEFLVELWLTQLAERSGTKQPTYWTPCARFTASAAWPFSVPWARFEKPWS
jgi:hypothetical protein